MQDLAAAKVSDDLRGEVHKVPIKFDESIKTQNVELKVDKFNFANKDGILIFGTPSGTFTIDAQAIANEAKYTIPDEGMFARYCAIGVLKVLKDDKMKKHLPGELKASIFISKVTFSDGKNDKIVSCDNSTGLGNLLTFLSTKIEGSTVDLGPLAKATTDGASSAPAPKSQQVVAPTVPPLRASTLPVAPIAKTPTDPATTAVPAVAPLPTPQPAPASQASTLPVASPVAAPPPTQPSPAAAPAPRLEVSALPAVPDAGFSSLETGMLFENIQKGTRRVVVVDGETATTYYKRPTEEKWTLEEQSNVSAILADYLSRVIYGEYRFLKDERMPPAECECLEKPIAPDKDENPFEPKT